jgi:hypothetical protein
MPRSVVRFHIEDQDGNLLGDPIPKERNAQIKARALCTEQLSPVLIYRIHPTVAPRRVLVFRAEWSPWVDRPLCGELYNVSR